MSVLFLLAGAAFLVAAMLLEEAAAWFCDQAVGTLRDDEEDEAGRRDAYLSREARLLGFGFGGAAFAVLAWATAPLSWGVGLILAAAVGTAVIGSALIAPHGRSPLSIAGRVLFQPLHWLGVVLRWVIRAVRRVSGLRTPHGPIDRVFELDRELRWLAGRPAEDEAGRVLATVHEFHEASAEDVMVPRSEVAGLSAGATVAEAVALVAEEGFSRYPVYRGSLDNVVGVLHVFDLLEADPGVAVSTLARPPLVTNATKEVSRLLRELQVSYNQMAVVADEFGGTAGIVTVEDLLEELVGEIRDETDEEETLLRMLEPGVYWVDASIPVDELNELLDLDLEEGETFDTLAGLVLERLERIPRIGERIVEDGISLEVAAAEPHRVHAFRLSLGNGGSRR